MGILLRHRDRLLHLAALRGRSIAAYLRRFVRFRLTRDARADSEVGDNGTRQLLEQMLVSEEEHEHWLESQLELIRQVGDANYLTSEIRKPGAE